VEETLCVELELQKEKFFMEMEVEEVMEVMVVKEEMDSMEEIVEKEVTVNFKFYSTIPVILETTDPALFMLFECDCSSGTPGRGGAGGKGGLNGVGNQ
jgi:hypothetical protein